MTKMPKAKQDKMGKTMKEFSKGDLHSGSKAGPKVKSRKQAIAIGLSQSGQSKKDPSSRGARMQAKKKGIVGRVGRALS